MTGSLLYSNTMGMLFDEDMEYKAYCLPAINALIAECFAVNNTLLRAKGQPELIEIPLLEDLEEELVYQPEILFRAMPYGLAAKIVYDDGDMGKTIFWRNQYIEALGEIAQAIPCVIEDVYR